MFWWAIIVFSLFFSIVIFIVVDRKIITFSSQSAEVLKDQNINVKYNEEQLAEIKNLLVESSVLYAVYNFHSIQNINK